MKKLIYIILINFILIENLYASQLHIEYFTVNSIIQSGGILALAKVVEIMNNNGDIKFKIKKIYKNKSYTPKTNVLNPKVMNLKKNQERIIKIFTGTEWKNPSRSPIENRLKYGTRFDDIKIGQTVYIAIDDFNPIQVIDEKKLDEDTLDILTKYSNVSEYLKSKSQSQLEDLLKNLFLAPDSFQELTKRNIFTPKMLITPIDDPLVYKSKIEILDKKTDQISFLKKALNLIIQNHTDRERFEFEYILSSSMSNFERNATNFELIFDYYIWARSYENKNNFEGKFINWNNNELNSSFFIKLLEMSSVIPPRNLIDKFFSFLKISRNINQGLLLNDDLIKTLSAIPTELSKKQNEIAGKLLAIFYLKSKDVKIKNSILDIVKKISERDDHLGAFTDNILINYEQASLGTIKQTLTSLKLRPNEKMVDPIKKIILKFPSLENLVITTLSEIYPFLENKKKSIVEFCIQRFNKSDAIIINKNSEFIFKFQSEHQNLFMTSILNTILSEIKDSHLDKKNQIRLIFYKDELNKYIRREQIDIIKRINNPQFKNNKELIKIHLEIALSALKDDSIKDMASIITGVKFLFNTKGSDLINNKESVRNTFPDLYLKLNEYENKYK